jgi:hypothetical protein
MTAPSAMLSKLKFLPVCQPALGPTQTLLAATAMNPMQFWVQWGNAQIN